MTPAQGCPGSLVLDPLVAAIGIGLLGSALAGPAVAYGLRRLPQRWRRTTEWLLIAAAVVVAVLADFLLQSPVGGVFVYVLAALPGLVAFLAWRTLLASTLVSLAPLYFVIGELTQGRSTYAPEIALDRALSLQPAWMLVYGSLYVFVVLLPLLVVRQQELFRRAMQAYLMVMIGLVCGLPAVSDRSPTAGRSARRRVLRLEPAARLLARPAARLLSFPSRRLLFRVGADVLSGASRGRSRRRVLGCAHRTSRRCTRSSTTSST